MDITPAMLRAARSAEFTYFQQNRLLGARFLPIPDGQLLAILEAAIGAIGEDDPDEATEASAQEAEQDAGDVEIPREKRPIVVRARKPRVRR